VTELCTYKYLCCTATAPFFSCECDYLKKRVRTHKEKEKETHASLTSMPFILVDKTSKIASHFIHWMHVFSPKTLISVKF
jgi:hypothetical protein